MNGFEGELERNDVTNGVSSSHHLSAFAQPEEDSSGVDPSWYVALWDCYHSNSGHLANCILLKPGVVLAYVFYPRSYMHIELLPPTPAILPL